jgi:hypothetical protein
MGQTAGGAGDPDSGGEEDCDSSGDSNSKGSSSSGFRRSGDPGDGGDDGDDEWRPRKLDRFGHHHYQSKKHRRESPPDRNSADSDDSLSVDSDSGRWEGPRDLYVRGSLLTNGHHGAANGLSVNSRAYVGASSGASGRPGLPTNGRQHGGLGGDCLAPMANGEHGDQDAAGPLLRSNGYPAALRHPGVVNGIPRANGVNGYAHHAGPSRQQPLGSSAAEPPKLNGIAPLEPAAGLQNGRHLGPQGGKAPPAGELVGASDASRVPGRYDPLGLLEQKPAGSAPRAALANGLAPPEPRSPGLAEAGLRRLMQHLPLMPACPTERQHNGFGALGRQPLRSGLPRSSSSGSLGMAQRGAPLLQQQHRGAARSIENDLVANIQGPRGPRPMLLDASRWEPKARAGQARPPTSSAATSCSSSVNGDVASDCQTHAAPLPEPGPEVGTAPSLS